MESCRCNLERQLDIREAALNAEEVARANATAEANRCLQEITDSRINLEVIVSIKLSLSNMNSLCDADVYGKTESH